MNATSCDVCLAAVDLVHAEVNVANVTAAVIGNAVMALCAVFGGHFVRKECSFIVEHIEEIVGFVKNGTKPQVICSDLHLC